MSAERHEADAIERLNRYWNAPTPERSSQPDPDPTLRKTVDRLVPLARHPSPDPAFVSRLEASLMQAAVPVETMHDAQLAPNALNRRSLQRFGVPVLPAPWVNPTRRARWESALAMAALTLLDAQRRVRRHRARPSGHRRTRRHHRRPARGSAGDDDHDGRELRHGRRCGCADRQPGSRRRAGGEPGSSGRRPGVIRVVHRRRPGGSGTGQPRRDRSAVPALGHGPTRRPVPDLRSRRHPARNPGGVRAPATASSTSATRTFTTTTASRSPPTAGSTSPTRGTGGFQRFDADRQFARAWPTHGGADATSDLPGWIAVGPDGNVYVSVGAVNGIVQVFSADGDFLRAFGSNEVGPGHLLRYGPIAFDPAGNLWVMDLLANELVQFSPAGEPSGRLDPAEMGTYSLGLPTTPRVTRCDDRHQCRLRVRSGRGLPLRVGKLGLKDGQLLVFVRDRAGRQWWRLHH